MKTLYRKVKAKRPLELGLKAHQSGLLKGTIIVATQNSVDPELVQSAIHAMNCIRELHRIEMEKESKIVQ